MDRRADQKNFFQIAAGKMPDLFDGQKSLEVLDHSRRVPFLGTKEAICVTDIADSDNSVLEVLLVSLIYVLLQPKIIIAHR